MTGTTDPSVITGITTLTANALVVVAVAGEDNNNGSIITTGTDPAAYTEHYVESSTGSDGVITFSEFARTTAGATGNVSVNWDTAVPIGFGGIVLALRPTTSALTIAMPAGTVQNDVMVASIGFRSNSPGLNSTDILITRPDGWALAPVGRVDNLNSTSSALAVYTKVAGVGEPANYTWTFTCIATCVTNGFNAAAGGIVSFSGVENTAPVDVGNGAPTAVATTTPATPSVVTTVANTMLITSHAIANANTWQVAPPSGMTQAFQRTSGGEMIQVSTVLQPAAGATGTKTATDLGGDAADFGNAHILALRPALPVFAQSAYRLFNNADSTNVGTALAAQDTAATLGTSGAAFRLRMLLHVAGANLVLNGQAFKLQFAVRSGTCDTAFTGEAYADVTAATAIAYNNNATPADGANLTANASDPTHGADTVVNQDYEELNPFDNTVAAINVGQDGKWDFSLIDLSAPAGTTYCFRVVQDVSGTLLDTYTVVPEITTAPRGTIFYFHDAATPNFGTLPGGTTLSGTTPDVTAAGAGTNRDMNQTIGATQVSQAISTAAITTTQQNWFRRFLSRPLAAQTLPTGVWQIQGGASESATGSNMLVWGAVIKVWRPSTGTVVATLLDDPVLGTVEPGTTETNVSKLTASINGVAVNDGDILVAELWAQNCCSATVSTNTIFYDGTTEGSTTSNAAFLQAPAAITFQRTTHQSAYRLFNNADATDVGVALAAQNTAAALGATGAAFRLRTLVHVSDLNLGISGQAFKLQFAARSGSCDTAFSGETYADVTAASVIAYNNNATPADGATLTANANDPTHGADTVVNQTYEELNNFTNPAAINAGQDGKWDFALKDNGAPASTAYCFRLVKDTGAVLDSYIVIPQITTAAGAGGGVITTEESVSGCADPVVTGVVLDAATQGGGTLSTIDVTHTISGGNRYVFVQVVNGNSWPTISSVVWDPAGVNEALSVIGTATQGTNVRTVLYGLVNPTAKTATMRVTLSAGDGGGTFVAVSSFTGVDQTTPLGTPATATGAVATTPTVTVTSATGELVIDAMGTKETTGNKTAGAGQSEIWDGFSGDADGAGSTNAGAASVVMSWTGGVTEEWAIVAVPLKPAAGSATSLTLPSWTPQANELLLVGISMRDEAITHSVTVNGLIWTLVADEDNDRGQMGVALYRASGPSPTAGSVVITLTGNTKPAFAVAVRLSNVDTAAANQGIEAIATASGPAGVDDANMKVTVTTVTPNAWALAWGGQRGSGTLTVPAGETIIVESGADCGTSGDRVRGHMWREIVATPGPTELGQDNSLSAAQPWAVIGVSIKPTPGGGPSPPGAFNVFESTTAAAAITGVIKTRVAGSAFSLDVVAITSGAKDVTFTDQVSVDLLGNNTLGVSLDANNCPTTSTLVQTVSPNPTITAGRSTVNFAAVANSWRDVRARVRWPASSPTVTSCSTDNFAIRPNTLASFAVTDTDWLTAGTGRTLNLLTFAATTPTHKAGQPFSVRATAVNAAGSPATTTNYTGAPTATLTTCGSAACTATFGTLTLSTAFAAGQLTTDVASYNDVGSFSLQLTDSAFASVDASDGSTSTERNITSAVINVGRFVPDHFAVALNTPAFGTVCAAGNFSYIGQTFSYTTQPLITVTAQDAANNTTTRYNTIGSWFRITGASLTGKAYTAATGTLDTSGLPGTDPVIASSGAGVGTLSFGSGTGIFFTRTTPVAPFDADLSLAINVIDADGVAYASNPARFGTATAGNGIAFNSGKAMRFGRLRLNNASGSSLLDLPLPLTTQYYDGTFFVTNTADSCTTLLGSDLRFGFLGSTPNLVACETAIIPSGTIYFVGGKASATASPTLTPIKLAKPGSGNDGAVDIGINLNGLSGNRCTAVGAAGPAATNANKPWLQGNWSGGTYTEDPTGRATFGIFKNADKFLYFRELY
ncbi:MAG: DUF6701 domain-containing protein [Betaproteobacteria bacterium]